MKRTRNAVRNVIFGGLLKGYQILVPFIMRTLLIRYLGMGYLGLNSLFTSILQILNLAELGVGSALGYSMYAPIAEGKKDEICALLSLYRRYYRLIGLGIFLAGIVLLPFLPSLVKTDSIPPDVDLYVLYLLHLGACVISYWLFAYKTVCWQLISEVTWQIRRIWRYGHCSILYRPGCWWAFVIITGICWRHWEHRSCRICVPHWWHRKIIRIMSQRDRWKSRPGKKSGAGSRTCLPPGWGRSL